MFDTAKPVVRQGRKTTGLFRETAGSLESFKVFASSISLILYLSKSMEEYKMRKGKLTLTLLAMMLLVAISNSGAYASVSGSGSVPGPEYVWAATGGDESELYSYSLTLKSDRKKGNSFSMFSWANPAEQMLLVAPQEGVIYNPVMISLNAGQYVATDDSGFEINLGETPQFGFSFSQDNDGTVSTYLTYALTKVSEASWGLMNLETGMAISVQGDVAPSSVPLPGSVLLFGSSLLGLLGIGSRKNKA